MDSFVLPNQSVGNRITLISGLKQSEKGETPELKIWTYDEIITKIGFGRYQLFTSTILIMTYMANSYTSYAIPIATSLPNSGAYEVLTDG